MCVIGAPAWYVFFVIELEALLIALLSTTLSLIILWAGLIGFQDILSSQFGLQVSANIFTFKTLMVFAIVIATTFLAAAIPSTMAYRSAKVTIR